MNRVKINLIFLVIFTNSCIGQGNSDKNKIIGVWQYKSDQIGAAYLENYQFFDNGTFIYNTSQYNELKRIISIKGTYKLESDTLHFTASSLIEDTGSNRLTRSKTSTINDSWSLIGDYKEEEIKLAEINTIAVPIKFCDNNSDVCILLEGEPFYKIIEDPSDY